MQPHRVDTGTQYRDGKRAVASKPRGNAVFHFGALATDHRGVGVVT